MTGSDVLREGRVESRTAWSDALGEEIDYRVYLPATAPDVRCPSVYLLHGRRDGDERNDENDWARVVPLLDELVRRRVVPPVVAVMPEAPWSGGGSWYVDSAHTGTPPGRPVETALTRDLVAHVDAIHPTVADRDHRVVGGFSMGGAGALTHVLRHPDVFSGALALSPAVYDPLPPADSATRVFGAFGRGSSTFDDDAYAASSVSGLLAAYERAGAPPVRLFLAAGDDHDLDQEATTMHRRAARTAGISSRLRVLPGGHDWDTWEPAFAEGLPFVLGPTDSATGSPT